MLSRIGRWGHWGVWVILGLGLALALAPGARAQTPGPPAPRLSLTAVAGWDGYYKDRRWLPVRVQVANDGPPVEALVSVAVDPGFGAPQALYETPVSLPTPSRKALTLYVFGDALISRLTVRLVDSQGRDVLAETETNALVELNSADLLYGVVSSEHPALDFLADLPGRSARSAVAYLDVDDLPEQAAPWNSFDSLIFANADTTRLSSAQQHGLQAWLATGGQLIVSGGPGAAQTAAGLADWLPVTLEGSQSLPDLPALREQLAADAGASLAFREPGPYWLTTSRLRQGDVWLHEAGLPLLARRAWGNGAVFFLALDPDLAPLKGWVGSPALWQRLVNDLPAPSWMRDGITDTFAANQAIQSLSALSLPGAGELLLFLLVYVGVIGPLNYWVLRARGRRELAWVTIPLLSLLFLLVAYVTGLRLKGNTLIVNQMSVVSGSAETGDARVETLLGLYSPRRAAYDLVLTGGMLPHTLPDVGVADEFHLIEAGDRHTLPGVRVDVSEVFPLVTSGYTGGLVISGGAVYTVSGGELNFSLAVRNESGQPLRDVALLAGRRAVPLTAELLPGQEFRTTTRLIDPGAPSVSPAGVTAYIKGGMTLPLEMLIGAGDPNADVAAYARLQLLSSLINDPYAAIAPAVTSAEGMGWFSAESLTLVAWSDQPQQNVAVTGHTFQSVSAAVYFLTLPVSRAAAATAAPLELGWDALEWRVLDNNIGLFTTNLTDLYLPLGWVEIAYRPWSPLQDLGVTSLQLNLEPDPASAGNPPPQVQLWNWQTRSWDLLPGASWGLTPIPFPAPYLDVTRTLRLRLENTSLTGLDMTLHRVYPIFTGILPAADVP